MIVDDQEINRVLIAELFKDEYNIVEAEDGKKALKIISERSDIVAIILDLIMPVMDGMEVLSELNRRGKIYHIPVFVITAADDDGLLQAAYGLGAVDIIEKPFKMVFIKSRIRNFIELFRHRNELVEMVEESVGKVRIRNSRLIEALVSLVEFRGTELHVNIGGVHNITKALLTELGRISSENKIEASEIEKIASAAIIHDVGKIAVPDTVIKKNGKLTDEEFEIAKTHVQRGCDILTDYSGRFSDVDMFRYAVDICRYHHERYDGKGYPDGLAGDDIPIWAQAAGLADAFDALVSERPYRPAFDVKTALSMINSGECGVFNPLLIKALNNLVKDGIPKEFYEE